MNRIISNTRVSENLLKFEVRTSIAVNEIKAGQYVILKLEKNEPGISLPVYKTNKEKETITGFVYVTDDSAKRLAKLNPGNSIFGIDGPFGYPVLIGNSGTVICVARGPGIVLLLPVLTSLRSAGNRIITILSAQAKEDILLEEKIKAVSDEMITINEGGSCKENVSICQVMGQILKDNRIDQVFAFGSAKIIKQTFSQSSRYDIQKQGVLFWGPTDEDGIYGIFRVRMCGSGKEICVDGFNFNAYYPNFDEMVRRFGSGELEMGSRSNISGKVNIPV
ncbi:MAG TPA: hypothetical protein VFC65_19115 [Prolixibacteraceae bacterium]|nr:hypothetical protein [Prolixibacteraceae bacterium]